MKQKLINVLKPLLADKGLSKEEIESLAEIYVKNLTETSTDAEIDNVAHGIVPVAELMQKSSNRLATSVKEKYKGFIDPGKDEKYQAWLKSQQPPKTDEPKPNPQNLTPEDIQKLIAEGIASGLQPFREEQERVRLSGLLNAHEKVKSIPESFRRRYVLDKEENLESIASQMEADFASVKQELIRGGQFQEVPAGGGGDTTDADIKELQEMVAKQLEANK